MKKLILPLGVFAFTAFLLFFVQWKVDRPMLMLEVLMEGGGWLEVFLTGAYGALVAWHMQDPSRVQLWRKYTWFAFTLVFFSKLMLGLLVSDTFLMTGKLHLPVPMMILAGPLYRGHISVMTILFLSTLLLSGPAWCSHLCYFGAIDNLVAGRRKGKAMSTARKWALKSTILLLVIAAALVLRIFHVPALPATLLAGGFGVVGLGVIFILSRRSGSMVHCTAYCPIGTLVNLGQRINPFRLRIDALSCTSCMACSSYCNYDALKPADIEARKPAITCTLCGDCLSSCHASSIRYHFPGLSPEAARKLYLGITISLHAATMALARI